MREGAEASNVVVEGNVDLDALGDQIFNLLELVQLVLAEDIVAVGDNHAGHEATKRGDTIAFTDTNNTGINVGSTSLKSAESVRNGAACIVVEVRLDIATHNTAQSAHEIVHLAGSRTANCVSDTDTVDANLVYSTVYGKEVDQVAAEGILGREADLKTLGLDEFDNFDCGVLDVRHILAVRVLTEIAGGTNNDCKTGKVSTCHFFKSKFSWLPSILLELVFV